MNINRLVSPVSFTTHLNQSLPFFITGSAYPTEQLLAAMLHGHRQVPTTSLENGSFGVVEPQRVGALVQGLMEVDRSAVRAAVEQANLAALVDDEELYDLEVSDPATLADDLLADLERLIDFYRQVVEVGGAVVGYVS